MRTLTTAQSMVGHVVGYSIPHGSTGQVRTQWALVTHYIALPPVEAPTLTGEIMTHLIIANPKGWLGGVILASMVHTVLPLSYSRPVAEGGLLAPGITQL